LILKGFIFALVLGNLLKPAPALGLQRVKTGLSTKLSTAVVDSQKSTYESRA
jgi:hypothetical protein